MMKIYGDKRSGNCLKVLYVAKHLGLESEWIDVDILKGESKTKDSLARNPTGQVPYVQFDNCEVLSQSNAILLYLAQATDLLPQDPWLLAKVYQWLFWEQYSHEPNIAVCRFHKLYLGKHDSELDPVKLEKGNQALDFMDNHLSEYGWFVGNLLTVADIALVAYTRLAHEGGFDLSKRTNLGGWVTRVEDALELMPVLPGDQ